MTMSIRLMTWDVLYWALGLALMGSVHAQGSGRLYLCPGNLYTNQLDARQAREQSCRVVEPARLSQALPSVPVAALVSGGVQSAAGGEGSGTAVANPATMSGATTAQASDTNQFPSRVASKGVAAATRTVDTATQRARDRDARLIIQTELNRTVERLEQLVRQSPSSPVQEAAVRRLREDEAALRRELARLPG